MTFPESRKTTHQQLHAMHLAAEKEQPMTENALATGIARGPLTIPIQTLDKALDEARARGFAKGKASGFEDGVLWATRYVDAVWYGTEITPEDKAQSHGRTGLKMVKMVKMVMKGICAEREYKFDQGKAEGIALAVRVLKAAWYDEKISDEDLAEAAGFIGLNDLMTALREEATDAQNDIRRLSDEITRLRGLDKACAFIAGLPVADPSDARTEAKILRDSLEARQADTARSARNMGVETDPTGRAPSTLGAKLDAGKAPILRGCIHYFPRALAAVAEVSAHGAAKYTWKGWETVPDGINRYGDALLRHVVKEGDEPDDADSGLLHAAHAAWNALARLELILKARLP